MTTFTEQVAALAHERLADLQPALDEADRIRRTIAASKGEEPPASLDAAAEEIAILRGQIDKLSSSLAEANEARHAIQEEKQQIARERREAREKIQELESRTDASLVHENEELKAIRDDLEAKTQAQATELEGLRREIRDARAIIQPSADEDVTIGKLADWATWRIDNLQKAVQAMAKDEASLADRERLAAEVLSSELKSGAKGGQTPERKSESAPSPDDQGKTSGNGKRWDALLLANQIAAHYEVGVEFNTPELAEKLDVPSGTIARYLRELVEAGAIIKLGDRGPNVKYKRAKKTAEKDAIAAVRRKRTGAVRV